MALIPVRVTKITVKSQVWLESLLYRVRSLRAISCTVFSLCYSEPVVHFVTDPFLKSLFSSKINQAIWI